MSSASWAAEGPAWEHWNRLRAQGRAHHGKERHDHSHHERAHHDRSHQENSHHERDRRHRRGPHDRSGFGPRGAMHMSRGGHGGPGFGFFGGRGFGPGDFPFGPGFWGPQGGRRRGPRAGRGDVRAGILALLA
jgi:hypothetical protein